MPETTFNQEYGPVGTVYNAENIYVQESPELAAAEPPPEQATLAATLVDRDAQLSFLLDRLALDPPQDAVGLVVVIEGCSSDVLHALVLRCARIEFPEAFTGNNWRYLKPLPWPESASGVIALLRTVSNRLGLPKALDQQGIEQAVAGISANICFCHFIDEERWAADGGALVRDWIAYLGGNALHAAAGYRLVAFVCVEQREQPVESGGFGGFFARLFRVDAQRAGDALEQFLAELRRRHPRVAVATNNVVVPPQLGLIRSSHVVEGIAAAAAYLKQEQIEGQLFALPQMLFETASERRFGPVFRSLQAEFAKLLRPRRRFAEFNH